MRSNWGGVRKHHNVSGAYALSSKGGKRTAAGGRCALIEQLCTRGMGANCRTALAAMADHGYKLGAAVHDDRQRPPPLRPTDASFEVFAEHLERAGAAADGAAVGRLAVTASPTSAH